MTKNDKELAFLDQLIDWYTENKPSVKRVYVTDNLYKILEGKPYRGFEIYNWKYNRLEF